MESGVRNPCIPDAKPTRGQATRNYLLKITLSNRPVPGPARIGGFAGFNFTPRRILMRPRKPRMRSFPRAIKNNCIFACYPADLARRCSKRLRVPRTIPQPPIASFVSSVVGLAWNFLYDTAVFSDENTRLFSAHLPAGNTGSTGSTRPLFRSMNQSSPFHRPRG